MKWKNELYNHKVDPPEEVWNRISHDLNNEFLAIKQSLYHAEIVPPANSWVTIQHSLDTASHKKFSVKRILRVAAAAALIGISFFTVNYFIIGNNPYKSSVTKAPVPNKIIKMQHKQPVANTIKEVEIPLKDKPMIASNIEPVKKDRVKATINASVNFYNDRESELNDPPSVLSIPDENTAATDLYLLEMSATKQIRNLNGEVREDVRMLDLPNSYFLMTGPNGQSVRVSSKFRNTIQYLNGESNEEFLDVILRESQYWRNQFKVWKQEVGQSSFIPSAENFMDIAELMKLLQRHNNK